MSGIRTDETQMPRIPSYQSNQIQLVLNTSISMVFIGVRLYLFVSRFLWRRMVSLVQDAVDAEDVNENSRVEIT